jgi:hypothetical protein
VKRDWWCDAAADVCAGTRSDLYRWNSRQAACFDCRNGGETKCHQAHIDRCQLW